MKHTSFSLLNKVSHLLFIVVLVVVFTVSVTPAGRVHAQGPHTADLGVRIVSTPRHVKACETFKATFKVTNFGPDPVHHLIVRVFLPDPFELVSTRGVPTSLAVGKTVTFSATIKVVAFVPGEPRTTWIGVDAVADPDLESSMDPNLQNNDLYKQIKMMGKPLMSCP